MRTRRFTPPRLAHAGVWATALATGLAACSDSAERGMAAPVPSAGALRAVLTGEAAARLDASGQFPLAGPSAGGVYPELNSADAVAAARAWVHDDAAGQLAFLEATRGATVDARHLAPCGRPLYARAAFVPPDASVIAPVRRSYGPWWLVTLCAGGTPQASVAVSAWATEMRVVNNTIHLPFIFGNEFFAVGIPVGHSGEYPASPEAAAAFVARQTGRHVITVPELVMQAPDGGVPQSARWVVRLDAPATLRSTTRGALPSNEVSVRSPGVGGLGVQPLAPLLTQPATLRASWVTLPREGELATAYKQRRAAATADIERRPDTPVRFERVETAGGQ